MAVDPTELLPTAAGRVLKRFAAEAWRGGFYELWADRLSSGERSVGAPFHPAAQRLQPSNPLRLTGP